MTLPPRPTIVACANLAWNLVNFRAGLLRTLIAAGFDVVAVAPPDAVMQQVLEDLGCRFVAAPVDAKGLSPWRDLRTFLALLRIVREVRPVAWLSWTIKPNVYGSLAAAFNGVPAFPNVSGLGTLFARQSLLTTFAKWLYRIAFRRAPVVFFQNREDASQFVAERIVQASQARLLPGSGVDLERFDVPEQGRRPVRRQFLMMARLIADKGVREYVAAAGVLREKWPDAQFRLLGFLEVANPTAVPAAEVHAWAAEGTIEYLPPVSDVRPYIAQADFVVLPSYYREGTSRALLEAASMGRPIVTTDWPGCRDVVRDGENGFLCVPRDVASLTQALERAASTDDAEWIAMAKAGRYIVASEFSQERVCELYLQALSDSGISPKAGDLATRRVAGQEFHERAG